MVIVFTYSCKKKDNTEKDPDPTPITVTDIDGNVYSTVTLGTQVWMKENLKVIHYRNGDAIPNLTDTTAWSIITTGAYCDFRNIPSNSIINGKLYNWFAVSDSRNIAPLGWHVPTETEWMVLQNYLIGNGYNYDGTTTGNKIAKSMASKTGWHIDYTSGTVGTDTLSNNSSGFSGFPACYRFSNGHFEGDILSGTCWWTNSNFNSLEAYYYGLNYNFEYLFNYSISNNCGFSVRCIKD